MRDALKIAGFRPLKLDLYRSTGVKTVRPAVIFLNGGGFAVGNPRAGASAAQGKAILEQVFHFLDTTFGT